MRLTKKKTVKKIKKTKSSVSKTKKNKKVKKIASLAKGIDIVQKHDGTFTITGKNAKGLDGATVERKERQYKFDERLVPYYLGGDSKEGNISLRDALIKLGKTPEMTDLFLAMKTANFAYREDAKETFIKALFSVIRGHDEVGLAYVYDEDIQLIHDSNLKTFDDFWRAKSVIASGDDEFAGFSD